MRNMSSVARAALLLALGALVSWTIHANDVAVPKQGFKTREEFAKYREAAWAHFQKRCKENAGEKVYLTIENVEGILLLKPRPKATDAELRDQYWRGDPYGHDSILPDSEIRNFLRYLDERDLPTIRETPRPGYSYVETKELAGRYRRYELDRARPQRTLAIAVDKPASRYGVTWEDISTDEDRKYWVAGGRLQILDLSTGQVLAERTGYLFELGLGSQSGGRRPWLHARLVSSDRAACPPFRPQSITPINRLFVEKVLKPKRRN